MRSSTSPLGLQLSGEVLLMVKDFLLVQTMKPAAAVLEVKHRARNVAQLETVAAGV